MAQPAANISVLTYKDYLNWPENEHWELIEGVPWNISPAPSTTHQRMARELAVSMYNALKKSSCELFIAPFDVRLPDRTAADHVDDDLILTVVQPDLIIVCDANKLDAKGCLGPPDVAVEILSPSTAYRDETDKLRLYEAHGVREYWIVNPDGRYIMVYSLDGKEYGKPEYFRSNETLFSSAVDGLIIDLSELFSCTLR